MKRAEALRLRAIVEMAAVSLDDKTASEGAMLFPRLKQNGALVPAGTRINWNGTVKKAAVDLWDTAESTPDAALTLWEDISYRDGIRIIPDAITAATAFVKGEQGWWHDEVYESLIDANVYTPAQYPTAWAIVH